MIRPPEAVRPYMEARRRVRAADHSYCGPDCAARESIAQGRRTVSEMVRALRAARRAEGALVQRWGLA